jgi:hypothetical protein
MVNLVDVVVNSVDVNVKRSGDGDEFSLMLR